MKLNKKGVSIIELIISVTLIALIMLFMYRLLSDITFEKDNDTFAFLYQEQRVTIIKRVEKRIGDAAGIKSITASDYNINFSNGSSNVYKLSYSSSKLTLTDASGNVLESWTYSGNGLSFSKASCKNKSLTNGTIYECTYKIYTQNDSNRDYVYKFNGKNVNIANNNIIDDLTFTFVIWK